MASPFSVHVVLVFSLAISRLASQGGEMLPSTRYGQQSPPRSAALWPMRFTPAPHIPRLWEGVPSVIKRRLKMERSCERAPDVTRPNIALLNANAPIGKSTRANALRLRSNKKNKLASKLDV